MRQSYVQIFDQESGRYKLIPKDEYRPYPTERTHLVMPDLPDYISPVTDQLVSGRRQRREDLARTQSRPYESGEREDARRNRALADRDLDRNVTRTLQDLLA